jgi:hypothetical protein
MISVCTVHKRYDMSTGRIYRSKSDIRVLDGISVEITGSSMNNARVISEYCAVLFYPGSRKKNCSTGSRKMSSLHPESRKKQCVVPETEATNFSSPPLSSRWTVPLVYTYSTSYCLYCRRPQAFGDFCLFFF